MLDRLSMGGEALRLDAAEVLGDAVHAAAECRHTGEVAASMWMRTFPPVALYLRRKAKKRAHGLPPRCVLAVTPSRLVALAARNDHGDFITVIKATHEIHAFPLEAARASTSARGFGAQLTVEMPSGPPFVVYVPSKDGAERVAEQINERSSRSET